MFIQCSSIKYEADGVVVQYAVYKFFEVIVSQIYF